MRQRWQIVLVDEFQDTDPVQWQVLDRAFSGHATMVLIGDPKQAIYAFRGGDVATYLRAAATATTRKTLAVNCRCDAALLDSLQWCSAVPRWATSEIVVRDVQRPPPREPARRRCRPAAAAAGGPSPDPRRPARPDAAGRPRSARTSHVDVARDIVRLLDLRARRTTAARWSRATSR